MRDISELSKEEVNPLKSMDEWEEDVLERYPTPNQPTKVKEAFRNYQTPVRDTVKNFYRLNHRSGTYD